MAAGVAAARVARRRRRGGPRRLRSGGIYGAAIVYRELPVFRWPPGRVIVLAYATIGVWLAVYFYPLWAGTPIPRQMYNVRMWFQAGPARWI